jgi:hypothetical protein
MLAEIAYRKSQVFEFPMIMKVPPGRLELPAQALESFIVSKLVGVGPCWWIIGQA